MSAQAETGLALHLIELQQSLDAGTLEYEMATLEPLGKHLARWL